MHLIFSTAFFTGASIGIAKQLKTPKRIYLASLTHLLEKHFGLSADNAAGMIESNARLYKRYTLIEKIYNAGWQSAINWQQDPSRRDTQLKSLLAQYHSLSMSNLNVEGIKEQIAAPPEVEVIAPMEPAITITIAKPRWGRRIFWLLFISLLALAGYFSLFPEQIPLQLIDPLPEQMRVPFSRWTHRLSALFQ